MEEDENYISEVTTDAWSSDEDDSLRRTIPESESNTFDIVPPAVLKERERQVNARMERLNLMREFEDGETIAQ